MLNYINKMKANAKVLALGKIHGELLMDKQGTIEKMLEAIYIIKVEGMRRRRS